MTKSPLCAASASFPGHAMAQSRSVDSGGGDRRRRPRAPSVGGVEVPDTTRRESAHPSSSSADQARRSKRRQQPPACASPTKPVRILGRQLGIPASTNRISETFDGVPLNDTGNYALSRTRCSPELIEQVNVSLADGVDSPTAAATAAPSISYRRPSGTSRCGCGSVAGRGRRRLFRTFGVIDTGARPWGTRAFGPPAWRQRVCSAMRHHLQTHIMAALPAIGPNARIHSISGHTTRTNNSAARPAAPTT